MKSRTRSGITERRDGELGFTLIETIVALALTGLVLSALATITAQWLPNWNHGIDRIQRGEAVEVALERISADLSAAEYVSANRDSHRPLFDGTELSVTFVRTALGPNAGPGLDLVRLAETTDHRELVMVRSRTRFAPLPADSSLSEQVHFGDPVLLLRPPFRLSFAYAGPDRVWQSTWQGQDTLPAMVRLTVRNSRTGRVMSVSTATPVHVQVPSDCTRPDGNCADKPDASANASNNPSSTASNAPGQAASAVQGATQ